MIIKGTSRAAPKQLGRHLLRGDTNEVIKILEIQSPTGDLTEAFRDWQLLAGGTNGTLGLYHAQISPEARYQMTPEQWQRSVEVLEKELGFTGQPRAIVLHQKPDKQGIDREHIHVVWQRTDIDTMTLLTDSMNYPAHERASLALENEFGHEHVPGKHAKRDREKQPEFPRAETTHDEWQQAERTGIDPRERKEAITALYHQSDSPQALVSALEENGYRLARGDRRDFVIVDEQGEVHSLARQIKDVTSKDLRAFMSEIDPQTMPTIEEAKALTASRVHNPTPQEPASPPATEQKAEPKPETAEPPPGPTREDFARLEAALKARHEEQARKLEAVQLAEYNQAVAAFNAEIAEKMQNLDALQRASLDHYDSASSPPPRPGLIGVLDTILTFFNPEKERLEAEQRDRDRAAFIAGQQNDRKERLTEWTDVSQKDLDDMEERHARQQGEQTASYEQELARYRQEHEAAQRLAAELAEDQRQQDLKRTRDGPEPPKHSL